ncbi:transposase [Paraburkholderia sp. GAS333]|uniref:transposase n=1 Tax=Paraburkholderia sp. GAS333 TaxID=3156279 RepID=UPI003D1A2F29
MPFSKFSQSTYDVCRLTDQEWERIAHLFPAGNTRGRPRLDARPVLEAVLWACTDDHKWSRLPDVYPPRQTCYLHFLKWRRLGLLARVADVLNMPVDTLCATTARD